MNDFRVHSYGRNDGIIDKSATSLQKIQIGSIEIIKTEKINGKVYACIKQMLKGFCTNDSYTLSPDGSIINVSIYNFHTRRMVSKGLLNSDCKVIKGDRYYELDKFIELLEYTKE